MINPLSNQNYYYQYSVGQGNLPSSNSASSQPQMGVSIPAISEIESNRRSQELGPKECKT
ncbi:MAG: hypothetical protein CVU71_03455 [Deltaproteobacteria bacterium HGW-Deltaproteobacteria-6]|jgi:hypothetical protein|nr:MAG: hypothetical protein CVU71_03455 [Deltaproteobacteria bacterium HGW-Deltaproteobacteria-6]